MEEFHTHTDRRQGERRITLPVSWSGDTHETLQILMIRIVQVSRSVVSAGRGLAELLVGLFSQNFRKISIDLRSFKQKTFVGCIVFLQSRLIPRESCVRKL